MFSCLQLSHKRYGSLLLHSPIRFCLFLFWWSVCWLCLDKLPYFLCGSNSHFPCHSCLCPSCTSGLWLCTQPELARRDGNFHFSINYLIKQLNKICCKTSVSLFLNKFCLQTSFLWPSFFFFFFWRYKIAGLCMKDELAPILDMLILHCPFVVKARVLVSVLSVGKKTFTTLWTIIINNGVPSVWCFLIWSLTVQKAAMMSWTLSGRRFIWVGIHSAVVVGQNESWGETGRVVV